MSGSVLGVNCSDVPLPFFPDIYNEDWFFFSKAVAHYELGNVGDAKQRSYEPFADPERARHEEFGDLLAEGLFSLIAVISGPVGEVDDDGIDHKQLFTLAAREYWRSSSRRGARLSRRPASGSGSATTRRRGRRCARSPRPSGNWMPITPELCTAFLAAWQDDLAEWEIAVEAINNVSSVWEAMNDLGLRHWRRAGYEDAHVEGPQRGAARRNRPLIGLSRAM